MKFKITPCLWFDGQAEQAARFYTGIFRNSRIGRMAYFSGEGFEHHGRPAGSVMTVAFELDGQSFTALNGGPTFHFTEAVSFQIECETQQEVDYYWDRLGEGGPVEARQCGWLKDQFGLSWQVVPKILPELLMAADVEKSNRAMGAMLGMKKLDGAGLQRAFDGG